MTYYAISIYNVFGNLIKKMGGKMDTGLGGGRQTIVGLGVSNVGRG